MTLLAAAAAAAAPGLVVSAVGLGAWSWGDRSRYWQDTPDKDSNQTVRCCTASFGRSIGAGCSGPGALQRSTTDATPLCPPTPFRPSPSLAIHTNAHAHTHRPTAPCWTQASTSSTLPRSTVCVSAGQPAAPWPPAPSPTCPLVHHPHPPTHFVPRRFRAERGVRARLHAE